MVRLHVQPCRGVGAERRGECEAEARALDHECVIHLGAVIVACVDGIHERCVGVAGVDRAHACRFEDCDGELGGRGLAIGTSDGEHRARPVGA